VCIGISGAYFAQEQNHLKGTEFATSPNAIEKVAETRQLMTFDVAVYPNPSQGNLFVEGQNGATVTVYSLEGTYVGTWEIGESGKVELTDLPQGSFVCSINFEEQRTMKKFIVL
jgi:myo-inositol-hexaphosphate 3-phosphohydrolase